MKSNFMKRGQGLSINTIVIAALSLVVLVILIFVVRTQLQKGTQKYTGITKEAETEARAKDICETLFALKSRVCMPSCDQQKFTDLGTNWADCTKKGSGYHCCEAP
jgi:hypothetical protein